MRAWKNIRKFFLPSNYWQKAIYIGNKTFFPFLDMVVAPNAQEKLKHPPVFLLGAPRSGSTLIYQVLIEAFDFAYLSNCHAQFFGSPALAEKIFGSLDKKETSDYTSVHGKTRGWSAPSECGEWWYRFFRRHPAYVKLEDVDIKKMEYFRRSLASLMHVSGKPMLFKNLYASLRVAPLAKHIPEALYVVIHRNEQDNGHSLLEGRKKVFGSYDNWWSVPPPNVESLKLEPAYIQVVEQIRNIQQIISKDLKESSIPDERIHHIDYENFCMNVHEEVKKFASFLRKNACIRSYNLEHVPRSFECRHSVCIDNALYQSMVEYIQKTKT